MTRIELVIFDIGGTAIRDTANVGAVFSSILKQYSIVVSDEELTAHRGSSKRRVIEELVSRRNKSGIDPAGVYHSFQQELLHAFAENGIQAISGIEESFRTLRNRGIKTALTTGFDRHVTEEILNRLGWNELVDCVVTGDDVENGRPAPDLILHAMRQTGTADPAAVVVVGDTVNDLKAAAAACTGAAIGVLSGAHNRKQLESAPHTTILQDATEVPQWLADHS